MNPLTKSLFDARVKNIDSRYFIPDRALGDILSDEAIQNHVQSMEAEPYHRREIIEVTANGGKRLFAILVLLGEESLLLRFIERDQMAKQSDLDSRLPLTLTDLEVTLGSGTTASLFYERQWELFPPYFCAEKTHRLFNEDTVFPFVGMEPLTEGGFGEVSKVTLHEAHHGFEEAEGQRVR